jgi:hypothetical protein
MSQISKLHEKERFDITFGQAQKTPEGTFIIPIKIETMELVGDKLLTLRKVSLLGSGASAEEAQSSALTKAIELLGL